MRVQYHLCTIASCAAAVAADRHGPTMRTVGEVFSVSHTLRPFGEHNIVAMVYDEILTLALSFCPVADATCAMCIAGCPKPHSVNALSAHLYNRKFMQNRTCFQQIPNATRFQNEYINN